MTDIDVLALVGTAISVALSMLMVAIGWYDRKHAEAVFNHTGNDGRRRAP